MSRYYVEFAGTFFYVLTIGLVTLSSLPSWIASVAVACVLTAVTFAGGHVSGAHFNPVLTLAFYLRGELPRAYVRGYLGAQIGAAIAAGFLAVLIRGGSAVTTSLYSAWLPASAAEFVFTFALVWVVLNVRTVKSLQGNPVGPLAIGLVVLAGLIAVGDISRAAFNPAVALAIAVMRTGEWSDLAIYVVAQVAGGVAATFAFDHLQENKDEPSDSEIAEAGMFFDSVDMKSTSEVPSQPSSSSDQTFPEQRESST
jgi:aquaporin Z